VENGLIHSACAGYVTLMSKLIMVEPYKKLYKPEVGDVVIGRVISVDKKSWRVDISYNRDANLSLSSINLPQGEQVKLLTQIFIYKFYFKKRIRSEEDAMQMRLYFQENDLLSGEIQQIHSDGGVNIQTRNLKYGKVN